MKFKVKPFWVMAGLAAVFLAENALANLRVREGVHATRRGWRHVN